MERERKSREEFVMKKFRSGNLVGRREGNCTPSPPWKFGFVQPDGSIVQDFNFLPKTTLSARKLGASLWEVQPHLNLKTNKDMPKPNHHKIEEFRVSKQLSELSDGSPDQATSGSGLRREASAITTQHNPRLKRVDHVQQPVSPASYCSSIEERRARMLLEDLCEEFAKGIRDYEQEIRLLRQKSHEDQIGREENDGLILHISEAWVDERKQIKLADASDVAGKPSVLDKLRCEIVTFLRAKQSGNTEINDFISSEKTRESNLRRRFLDSQLNKEVSLKQGNDGAEGTSSIILDSRLIETAKSKPIKKKAASREFKGSDPSRRQIQLEEQVTRYHCSMNKEPAKEKLDEMTSKSPTNLIRNPSMSLEGKKLRYGNDYTESSFDLSTFTGPSPFLERMREVKAADPNMSKRYSRWRQSFKPNTLQDKLLEARLEGLKPCARVCEGLSQVD